MAETPKNAEPVVITGLGLMTAVGHKVKQAVTSMRASVMRLSEYPAYEPIVRDPAVQFPEPLIAAPVTGITDGRNGIERLFALAEPALREALAGAGLSEADAKGAALLVACGEGPGRGAGSRLATVFAPRLAQRVFEAARVEAQCVHAGTAGVLVALHQAAAWLRDNVCQQCVIGGVDSWLDAETLIWIDEARRLKSAGIVDGFVPGEAAAFLIVELLSSARQRQAEPYAVCGDVALAEEKNTIWTESPCVGEGLAQCLKPVLADLVKQLKPPGIALCDLNGESYRSSEWGFAIPRVFQGGLTVPPLFHPADCTGDVGAAAGGILLALAAFSLNKKLAAWPSALVWCSGDTGQRAACSLLPI